MFRINTLTKLLDLFGAGKHGFRDGNRAQSIPATDLSAEWCNSLQEEIANVIEAAGIVLDAENRSQLLQAIQQMVIGAQKAVVISNATFEASVATGEVVRWDSGNNRFDEAIADGTANNRAVGVADVANSKVYLYGECPLFVGLTPGARYFLDAATPGAVTTVAPADGVTIGIAKSATTLFVDPDTLGLRADQANVFTKGNSCEEKALPGSIGTLTFDLAEAVNWGDGVQLTGDIVLAAPLNRKKGQSGVITIINDAVTPRTIAYHSVFETPGGSLPALTATAGAKDRFGYYVGSDLKVTIVQLAENK